MGKRSVNRKGSGARGDIGPPNTEPTARGAVVRPAVAALDGILGKELSVLDAGFVRLIDYMGDDSAVVQAARVSYGAGTKRVQDDRGLIRYLMRHGHSTPFEMCEIKLHVRAPMDVWRQWIRHRTANVNEYSTRYSIAIDAAQRTPADRWRVQSAENKQGSSGFLSNGMENNSQLRKWTFNALPARHTRSALQVASPESRPEKTYHCRLIPKPIGRLIYTIYSTF